MAKLKSNLSKIAREAPQAALKAMLQTGADVLDVAKQLVPVDTSSLKASGGVVPEDSSTVIVGFGGPGVYFSGREPERYATHVEYGTVKSPAQPFLRPAMMQAEPTYRKRLLQALEEIK